jgi:hypothetical protein
LDETLQSVPPVKNAVHKMRSFVNYLKESSNEKQKFHKILTDAGVTTMTIIQGTDNR